MRHDIELMALLLAGCVVPPVDYAGKICDIRCPAGECQLDICVPTDRRLCEFLTSAEACFDFEGDVDLVPMTVTSSNGSVTIDRESKRSGAGTMLSQLTGTATGEARLSIALPAQWTRASVAFDLLSASDRFVSSARRSFVELRCDSGEGGLAMWYEQETYWLGNSISGQAVELQAPITDDWVRVTILIARQEMVTVRVDRQDAATMALSACEGAWSLSVGLAGSGAASAWYDNVVLEVE